MKQTKNRLNLVIMLVMVQTFFAACTQDDEFATASGDELQINITTVGYASIEPGAPETRASDNGDVTTFATNDEIGIIAVQGGAVVQNNIPYKLTGSTWGPSGSSKATIPQGTGVTWLVYYPYSNTMDGKKTETEILNAFTVPADQSDQEKYTGADLMICTGSISGNTLTASLTHRLAMLEINLPAGAGNAKLKVNGGAERTPWNISGTTWRYLVKPATSVSITGSHTHSGININWPQTNVKFDAGKYTKVNITNSVSTIDGYTGNIEVTYKEGGNVTIPASEMRWLLDPGKTIRSIKLVSKDKTHLIGRVVDVNNPVKLKFDASGNLLFRDAVDGYIPVGSYAEFRMISGNGKDKKYRQEADLDLMDEEWTPIINDSFINFYGEYDGAGKKIWNLSNCLFRNNEGKISNVHIVSGTINAVSYIGGICGINYGQISSCSNAATVSGSSGRIGGVVGQNAGIVAACCNTGKVEGIAIIGGVVGLNAKTVTACYNTGAVKGTGDYIGGVVGYSDDGSVVTACYNTGKVEGVNAVGSVVGENQGTVTACYNTGPVTGTGDNIGGVVGYNEKQQVTACYNTGKVTGGNAVGGLVGNNVDAGHVFLCYNTGAVSGGGYVGGVVGENNSDGKISGGYWKTGTAAVAIGHGASSGSVYSFAGPYFTPGGDAWKTGTGGENRWWKAGTVGGDQFPKLWFE